MNEFAIAEKVAEEVKQELELVLLNLGYSRVQVTKMDGIFYFHFDIAMQQGRGALLVWNFSRSRTIRELADKITTIGTEPTGMNPRGLVMLPEERQRAESVGLANSLIQEVLRHWVKTVREESKRSYPYGVDLRG